MRRLIPPLFLLAFGLAALVGSASAEDATECSVSGVAHYLAGPGAGKESPLDAVLAAYEKLPIEAAIQTTVIIPPEVLEDEEQVLIAILIDDDVFYVAERTDGFVLDHAFFCDGVEQ